MIEVTVTLKIEEENLREIFDDYEIKFSKKKAKEVQDDMNENLNIIEVELGERFEEIVAEWVDNTLNV